MSKTITIHSQKITRKGCRGNVIDTPSGFYPTVSKTHPFIEIITGLQFTVVLDQPRFSQSKAAQPGTCSYPADIPSRLSDASSSSQVPLQHLLDPMENASPSVNTTRKLAALHYVVKVTQLQVFSRQPLVSYLVPTTISAVCLLSRRSCRSVSASRCHA